MQNDKSNKPVKRIDRRYFTFFGGIAFCLFAVVLILNVGLPARAISFPFAFMFGLASYVIYVFIYAYGLFLFFREKRMKIRLNNYFFGGLLIFISILIISTLIVLNSGEQTVTLGIKDGTAADGTAIYGFSNYYLNNVFNALSDSKGNGYWMVKIVSLFKDSKFGGGYAGYALVGLLTAGVKTTGAWVIGILIFFLGAFIIFLPQIIKIIKGRSSKTKKSSSKANDKYDSFKTYDAVATASRLNEPTKPVEEAPTQEQPVKVANYNDRAVETPSISAATYGVSSSFIPATFAKYQTKPQVVEAPISRPAQPTQTVNQQLKLDFDQKPQINEEILTVKPEVMEVHNVERPVAPMPTPVPTPTPVTPVVSNETKVRKPIKWIQPSSELLETIEVQDAIDLNNKVADERQMAINSIFDNFQVGAVCDSYVVGPSVTRYNISYSNNVSSREVFRLVDDLSIRLGGVLARFVTVVEGQTYSGLEIPNAKITTVTFKEVYESLPDVKKHPLAVVFGKNIDGKFITADFDEFPHILVAGTTGSGKSIYTHSVVATLIMRNSPEDLKLVLIDPKKVEMNKYRDLPHLLCPIINDANIAKLTMSKLCDEMNRRYEVLDTNGVSNIKQYNELLEDNPTLEKMPYIVVVIDEYADLVDTNKDIGMPVVSIAQKARACGIHMLISTQRPSTNIITGVIKGNLPTRVALAVASQVDSVTIIGEGGAEKLLGRGDMLVQSPLVSRQGCVRLQGCFIQNKEINRVVGYLKQNYECNYDPNFCNLKDAAEQAAAGIPGSPEFQDAQENSEEAKYQSVKEWVMSNEYMSMSRIQRECAVGFNRAGRFFKRLQDEGVVATEVEGNKGCPVLVHEKFYEGSPDTDIPVSTDQSEL